ncbi:putative mitotic-spindle organizing protein 1 [Dipodascopsis tothii]|uniref:putative mitotic-spindle organizing protein 1 n=1 Tax=Dipodascopsis tothii TaxID=44089 RepID=UPI0034CFB899
MTVARPTSAQSAASTSAAREVIDILYEISLLLNTGLDKNTLSLCVSLCENGANPEALATVIKELRRDPRSRRRQSRTPISYIQ